MPLASDSLFQFPNYSSLRQKEYSKRDHIEVVSDDDGLDIFSNDLNEMAGSPGPFIKDEPAELNFDPRFHNYTMEQHYNHHNGQQFGQTHEDGSINPSELHMSQSFLNNQFPSHNMTGSFGMGHSGIADDELLELSIPEGNNTQNFNNFSNDTHQPQSFFRESNNGGPVNIGESNQAAQLFSHTPEGAAPFSPYLNNNFAYGAFQPGQRPSFSQGIVTQGGSMPNGGFARPRIPMERQASDSRSPMTPKTGLQNLHIGTPESSSYGAHPIMHRQQKSIGSHWDNTPGSANSFLESPMSSPRQGSFHHPAMSEVIAGKHPASLPVKVNDAHGGATMQTQEAKRKKRRESHNAVERRRRDNINERIHDLSRLVPQHRLEDEKIRKHIHNNGPLSPTLTATGISPPHATSLLAGGVGRRAAGNITQGLPIEDKDKGPNKGDILNGAVSWTRDLMWILYEKMRREEELKNLVSDLGGTWPYEHSEEEIRMRSELIQAVERNGPESFQYSRGPGTGLRVPGHTNVAGDQLPTGSPQGLSPAMQSGGSGSNTGPSQMWPSDTNRGSFSLKEEDEFMDM